MTFWGTSVSGDKILLGEPSAAVLLRDCDAPADLLEVKFPADKMWDGLAELELCEGDEVVFRGIVDEQNTLLSASGLTVELVCRSREAILLDNEAEPCSMLAPSLAALESKFLLPLGFAAVGDKTKKQGELTISKGESVWAAVENFCEKWLGAVPFVDSDGALQCITAEKESVQVSQIIEAQIRQLPYKRISEVWQQSCRGSYDTPYRSGRGGVKRRRYLSMESTQSAADMIEESERESVLISLTCAGAYWPGRNAVVSAQVPGVGTLTDCPVRSIKYTRDKNGERTCLVLEGGASLRGGM